MLMKHINGAPDVQIFEKFEKIDISNTPIIDHDYSANLLSNVLSLVPVSGNLDGYVSEMIRHCKENPDFRKKVDSLTIGPTSAKRRHWYSSFRKYRKRMKSWGYKVPKGQIQKEQSFLLTIPP